MSTRELRIKLTPLVIAIVFFGILCMAVYNPPFGKMTCTISSAPGDPHAEYTYKVNFNFWRVNTVESTEMITSKNKDILKLFQEMEEQEQAKHKNETYYTMTSSIKNNTLTSVTTLQYKQAQNAKLKKISINKLKKIYLKNGAICSYR